MSNSSCRNCRRPIYYLSNIGWLHGELVQYAHEEITCEHPHPVECRSHKCKDMSCQV
jgi:hypothetical protein